MTTKILISIFIFRYIAWTKRAFLWFLPWEIWENATWHILSSLFLWCTVRAGIGTLRCSCRSHLFVVQETATINNEYSKPQRQAMCGERLSKTGWTTDLLKTSFWKSLLIPPYHSIHHAELLGAAFVEHEQFWFALSKRKDLNVTRNQGWGVAYQDLVW